VSHPCSKLGKGDDRFDFAFATWKSFFYHIIGLS
jgi:hypothetical protein